MVKHWSYCSLAVSHRYDFRFVAFAFCGLAQRDLIQIFNWPFSGPGVTWMGENDIIQSNYNVRLVFVSLKIKKPSLVFYMRFGNQVDALDLSWVFSDKLKAGFKILKQKPGENFKQLLYTMLKNLKWPIVDTWPLAEISTICVLARVCSDISMYGVPQGITGIWALCPLWHHGDTSD